MYTLPLKRMRGQVALALGILLATTNSAAAQPAGFPANFPSDIQARVGIVTVAPPKIVLPKAAPLELIAPPPPAPVCLKTDGSDLGVAANVQAAYLAMCALFPQVSAFGGLRPGDGGDHGTGKALDCMISTEVGDALAEFILAHAAEFGVTYVIWKQRIRYPGSDWQMMEDRGSITENHYDHVHVSFA